MKTKLLILEDDIAIQKALKYSFNDLDYDLYQVYCIEDAQKMITNNSFDIILMDINLPDGSGLDFLEHIRSLNIYTPVICISANDDEMTKVLGLGIGADDYITKPFHLEVLKSKIKAIIRRSNQYNIISTRPNEKFIFDNKSMTILMNNKTLILTSKELLLLKYFIDNPNQVFSKEQLHTLIWNDSIVDDNTITVYVKRLRHIIEIDPKNPQHLLTVWGIGYKFINI